MLKKLISCICIVAVILSVGAVAFAEEVTSVGFNIDKKDYSDVLIVKKGVEKGVVYVPLRMVFPNTNDMNNKVGMMNMWEPGTIRLLYGPTTGEDVIVERDEQGNVISSAIPFVGTRTSVDIVYNGDPYAGSNAHMMKIKYEGDPQDAFAEGKELPDPEFQELAHPIIMKSTGTERGYRFFVSLEDINTIAAELGLSETYSVKVNK